MNRSLTYINAFGVTALAALCATQWWTNRRLNLAVVDLDHTRQVHERQIEDDADAIKGLHADVEDFRTRLSVTRDQLDEARHDLAQTTADRDRVAAERDQLLAIRDKLKKAVDDFSAAVDARDKRIKKDAADLSTVIQQRDAGASRYNDLATKYNKLVKDFDELRAR